MYVCNPQGFGAACKSGNACEDGCGALNSFVPIL